MKAHKRHPNPPPVNAPDEGAAISLPKAGAIIVWIRRELRLQDHLALWSAAQDASSVIPLFILDASFHGAAQARQLVVRDGITELRRSLRSIGGDLIIRSGEPDQVIHALLRESGAAGVYCTKEYHPGLRLRDSAIRSSVESANKIWREFKDHVLFEEEEILSKSASAPFTVFTPYSHAWKERQEEVPPPLPPISAISVPMLPSIEFPELAEPAGTDRPDERPRGGESRAHAALDAFLGHGVRSYHTEREFPARPGTSRLSHHLSSGSLGIRTAYHALREHRAALRGIARQGPDSFLTELIWREFYYQILANHPRVAGGSFKQGFDRLAWSSDEAAFAAWKSGMTGYPIVDAAMRQLAGEGWMHNRCRMIVASFLTKDLHIDWRKGEDHFMHTLADGDAALNNGGWQWSAGTGNDAQPWFRIFNPTLQSKKFDPKGAYIRKYVPELARVPSTFVHEPWSLPPELQREYGCRIGKEYPAPIVDHGEERLRALELYGRLAAKRAS